MEEEKRFDAEVYYTGGSVACNILAHGFGGSAKTWKKLGFSKGTLHYMKQNAKSDKSFTLNSHVLERVKAWENLVSGCQVKI